MLNYRFFVKIYCTRAIKGRADYSKIIFWEFSAASNQERLQFEKYFLDAL